jgi:hypothetical protein
MTASDHVERVVIDLVGDLAAYRPGAKIVLFEGGGDTDFDVRMTCTLFPRFQTAVNPISSGNKRRVHDLYAVLEEARKTGAVPGMFFSITDRDAGTCLPAEPSRQLSWDTYHIENYLLEPKYILSVLKDLLPTTAPSSEKEVYDLLLKAARSTINPLVAHRMRMFANAAIVGSIDLGFDPMSQQPERLLKEAIDRSRNKLDTILSHELSQATIREKTEEFINEYNNSLRSGTWIKDFPGRSILSTFCGTDNRKIRYEHLRDLIIAKMRDSGFEPPGMKSVIEQILNEAWRR